jgi:Domain of unknown function (DUF4432)
VTRTAPYDFNRNWGARCAADVALAGRRAVVLENAALRVAVLADKGTDVVELLHKPTDTDFMWRAPRERGAAGPPNGPGAEGDFVDQYLGGWHEMLPNTGPGALHGTAAGLCGEVTLLPWEVAVERDAVEEVCVRFSVRARRVPLRLVKRLRLLAEAPTLFVEEEVVNEGGQPVEFAWGHHPVLGPAFLTPDCRIETAGGRLVSGGPGGPTGVFEPGAAGTWPHLRARDGALHDLSRVRPYEPGFEEDVYLPDVAEPWVGVTDPERGIGFGLAWERDVFPNLWLWQSFGGRLDYPWYGRIHCLGVELMSSRPFELDDARAAGTLLRLGAGERLATRLCATVYRPRGRLTGIALDGTARFAG